jgi:uncharacterized membrane protein YkvI
MNNRMLDIKGWLASIIFALTVLIMGFMRILNRYTNTGIIVMFLISVGIVFVLNLGEKDIDNNCKFEEENEYEKKSNNNCSCCIGD